MKRGITLFGFYKPDVRKQLYEKFKDACPKEFKQYLRGEGAQLPFEPDSPELASAIKFLEEHGEKYKLHSEVYYTRKELAAMEFFELIVPDFLEMEGTRTDDYGTKYAYECPDCGFKSSLIGDVLVDRKLVKKRKIGKVKPEYFVSEEVKDLFEHNGFTGISFDAMVKDYKGRDIAPLYVANITSVLPPLSNSMWLEPAYQPPETNCEHRIIYQRSELQYERDKMKDAMDFNLTYEHLTNSKMQCIVVSARAKKLLQENHIFCRFEPVTVLDE